MLHCADAEIKVPSAEIPELSRVLSFKLGVGQNVAFHALPTARNCAFLIFAFSFHSTFLFFSLFSPQIIYTVLKYVAFVLTINFILICALIVFCPLSFCVCTTTDLVQ